MSLFAAPAAGRAPRAGVETAPAPVLKPGEETAKELDSVWNVVVFNDPVNLMSYVTHVFMKIFGYPEQVARRHMLEVHHLGRSIVWSGGREQAELYVQELHAHLLLASLERAEK